MNEIKLKISIDGKEANATIQLTDTNIKELYKSFKYGKNEVNGFTTAISQGFNNAREIIGGFKEILSAVRSAFSVPLQVYLDAEQAQVSFEVLLGSAEKAKTLLNELKHFGATTPLELKDLRTNANLLLNFGFTAEQIIPTLRTLGDISGGNAQKLNSLTLAFAQSSSAGRLTGQDLMQMINAGFNPLQQIAEKTGKTMASLKKEMESGNITFGDVKQAFTDATSEGGKFFGMLQKQSETAGGAISNYNDAITTAKEQTGLFIAQALTPAVQVVSNLITKLNELNPSLLGIIGLTGTLTGTLITLRVTGILPATSAMLGFSTSLTAVQAALIKTGLFAALVALGYGLHELTKAWANYNSVSDNANNSSLKSVAVLEAQSKSVKQLTTDIKYYSDEVDRLNKELKPKPLLSEEEKKNLSPAEQAKLKISRVNQYGQEYSENKESIQKKIDQYKVFIEAYKEVLKLKQSTSPQINSGNEEKSFQPGSIGYLQQELAKLNEQLSKAVTDEDRKRIVSNINQISAEIERMKLAASEKPETPLIDLSPLTDITLPEDEILDNEIIKIGVLEESYNSLANAMSSTWASQFQLLSNNNSMLQQAINYLGQYFSQLVLISTFKGALSAIGGGNFITGFLGSLFGAASGAVVTKPTLMVVGEGNEPEGVFPLSKLNQMLSIHRPPQIVAVNVSAGNFRLRGQDIEGSLTAFNSFKKRKT